MTKKGNSAAEKKQIDLGGEITIYRAAALKKLLIEAVQRSNVVEVGLSDVIELDTAGTQILILAKRTARSLQHELHLTGHSAAVLEVFELLNLIPYFGDAVVIPSQSNSGASRTV